MPGVEVPIAHNTGMSPFEGLAGLGGRHEPFSVETLVSLYGDRDTYVARFSAAAAAAVMAGVLRPSEADGLIADARQTPSF